MRTHSPWCLAWSIAFYPKGNTLTCSILFKRTARKQFASPSSAYPWWITIHHGQDLKLSMTHRTHVFIVYSAGCGFYVWSCVHHGWVHIEVHCVIWISCSIVTCLRNGKTKMQHSGTVCQCGNGQSRNFVQRWSTHLAQFYVQHAQFQRSVLLIYTGT